MTFNPFNPFNKPVSEGLGPSDLQVLMTDHVAEGYHVEYKADFSSNRKIGHSIASFANTYGGWYIVGVEANNSDNTPTCISGFSLNDVHDPIAKVRDVAKSHIDPIPMFYPQVVSLPRNKAVLVVYIPAEQETPFVSRDGRIYRRNSDSSDPVSENDRYALDRLIESGRNARRRFETFCKDTRVFSQAEDKQGWVNIFLSPYPFGVLEKDGLLSVENIDILLENSNKATKIPFGAADDYADISGNIPFDSARTTHRSIALEQRGNSMLYYNTVSIELFVDGRAKIFIPLRHIDDFSYVESKVARLVLREARREENLLRFFDMGDLWLSIACLMNYYEHWLERPEWLDEVQVGIMIQDVWRAVAFHDSDHWGEHTQKFGLPIIREDSIRVPDDIGRGPLQTFSGSLPLWMWLGGIIGTSLGLPKELSSRVLVEALIRASNKKRADG